MVLGYLRPGFCAGLFYGAWLNPVQNSRNSALVVEEDSMVSPLKEERKEEDEDYLRVACYR